MKPAGTLVAERRAAQHCAELVRPAPAPADPLPRLARLGERLAAALAGALAPLHGGEPPAADALPVAEGDEPALISQAGPLGTGLVVSTGIAGVNLLAVFGGAAPLQLVDRAFGGRGEAPAKLPPALPLSAAMMAGRIQTAIVAALRIALDRDADAVRLLRSGPQLAELAPFPAGSRLAVQTIAIGGSGKEGWQLAIALPLALLGRLFDGGDPSASARAPADPAEGCFAEVPLPLRAVLVDMPLALATAARIEVGMVLPVATARTVPIIIGDQVIAHGTVGSQDNRVAVRLARPAT